MPVFCFAFVYHHIWYMQEARTPLPISLHCAIINQAREQLYLYTHTLVAPLLHCVASGDYCWVGKALTNIATCQTTARLASCCARVEPPESTPGRGKHECEKWKQRRRSSEACNHVCAWLLNLQLQELSLFVFRKVATVWSMLANSWKVEEEIRKNIFRVTSITEFHFLWPNQTFGRLEAIHLYGTNLLITCVSFQLFYTSTFEMVFLRFMMVLQSQRKAETAYVWQYSAEENIFPKKWK